MSKILQGFWRFLNTDVREIPWLELAEGGADGVEALQEVGPILKEHVPKLQPYIESSLAVLDSPATQVLVETVPLVKAGAELLKVYFELAKEEPTYASAVMVAAQLAYLQSLETTLATVEDEDIKEKLAQVSLQKLITKQLKELEEVELSTADAKTVMRAFPSSELAQKFGQALAAELDEAGLDEAVRRRFVSQVVWGTHQHFQAVVVEAGDAVEPLAEMYRTDGQAVLDRYGDIEAYLQEQIAALPKGQVFDEANLQFQDIYVPLKVQPLTQEGTAEWGEQPCCIHDWVLDLLEKEDDAPRQVMFIEGEAGRGKSVFCRMFADEVWRELWPTFIPVVIRLRNLRVLANNLTDTLADCPELEQEKFVQGNPDWLADKHTRYLLILDGFDELLLEGRAAGGLKDFLQQVADFQARSHHQCIVTGRPLALQGVERLITQTKGLARVRLEPMDDGLREQWLTKWQGLFGAAEVQKFREFIDACPSEIADELAREPLLLYLLGRLHREGRLSSEMFVGTVDGGEKRVSAKLLVYRRSVRWVLERQRDEQNERLAGLEPEDLREVLQEAALCVVQSGNETAQLAMLKNRFQNTANPVARLLKESQRETGQAEDKALNNLLTTFYLKPGEGDKQGSVEFAHKSFGEYLFAERLVRAFEDWTELNRRGRPQMDERALNGEVYDLLGYGGLSVEIVEYLFELLAESAIDRVLLFERLHEFYLRWCGGEFLDQAPTENLPQKKWLQLQSQGLGVGLKGVDVFAGLNVMIVLFKLHAAAQSEDYPNLPDDAPEPEINFHPCGEPGTEEFKAARLLKIIYAADSLGLWTFTEIIGPHLNRANLNHANLFSANLSRTNLIGASLESANLNNANLISVSLESANLNNADLISADLFRANFSNAHLISANLESANLGSANLNNADLNNAILLGTDLHKVENLSAAQLNSEYPPLVCGTKLPEGLNCDCDWDKLPPTLHKRYPSRFGTLEKAKEWVRERRNIS